MKFVKETLNEIKEILEKEFLNLEETANYLSLSKSKLYKLTSKKEIPHYKPSGKIIYFKRSEINEWVFKNKITSVEELENELEQYMSNNSKNKML